MGSDTQNTDPRVPPSNDSNVPNNRTFALRARGPDPDVLEASSIQSAGNGLKNDANMSSVAALKRQLVYRERYFESQSLLTNELFRG